MRIISKFKDYYDGVQAYGHDQDLCYVRKEEESDEFIDEKNMETFSKILNTCPKFLTAPYKKNHWNSTGSDPSPFIIGFCGKFYVGARITVTSNDWTHPTYESVYSIDDVVSHINEIEDRAMRESQLTYLNSNRRSWMHGRGDITKRDLYERFFASDILDSDNFFFEWQTPVFVITKGKYRESGYYTSSKPRKISFKIIRNPCLKDYGFARVMDPYTTFQEIDMYLGGVLGVNEPDTVDISDDKMRDKKGFDDYSFKKAPTKRKA